jgi:hypothetical protein
VIDMSRKPDLDADETAALAVAAGGALALVLGWILDSGWLRLFGFAGSLAGGGLYARSHVTKRDQKIEAAESAIRSELDDLDPVARMQILADLAHPEQ